jgi:hypothetical protein
MKVIPYLLIISSLPFLFSCAAPIQQFFPDKYFPQDHIYQNKLLQFTLRYSGNWNITTDPNAMNKAGKKVAMTLHDARCELLFLGSTIEGTQGTRGIVENLNISNEDFLESIRKTNRTSIDTDLTQEEFDANGIETLKWQYLYKGFHFVEFLFRSDTYNIRIAFWTSPDLFNQFLPVYEEIMNSIEIIDRY